MLDDLGVPLTYTHEGSAHVAGEGLESLSIDPKRRHDRIVFLARHPIDTAVSGYYQATKRIGRFDGTLKEFIRSPSHGVPKIVRFIELWEQFCQSHDGAMLVTYEELSVDTVETMRRILRHLRVRVAEDVLQRVVDDNRFQKMRAREQAGYYSDKYGKILVPSDPDDPNSYKVRKGKIGSYAEVLDDDDIGYCFGPIDGSVSVTVQQYGSARYPRASNGAGRLD